MSENETELFKPWPKITRKNPFIVTVSEKIDGTNSCVIIKDGEIVGIQSRKRFITVENDNCGFAKWVRENEIDLLTLGDGYHYGEWAGKGIQKNPLKLNKKKFFLFNTYRWQSGCPKCCSVVPILYEGELKPGMIEEIMFWLKTVGKAEGIEHEGICVYYHAFRLYTKHTFKYAEGKWKEQ